MAVVELSRLPRSEIIAGTADDRLPILRTPSIKPVSKPVTGSVPVPCGTVAGIGIGSGAATGTGAEHQWCDCSEECVRTHDERR